MQYRIPVGCGPSSKTCPRWASHRLHFTSVRRMPWLVSVSASTASSLAGAQKLGHPEPAWNLVSERKRGWPQQTHLYVPGVSVSSYSPVKGASVPFGLVTSY